MNNRVYIYALAEPDSNRIRYVGKTKTDPKARLRCHLSPQQINRKDHRGAWLRSLKSQGMKPALHILEETDEDGWEEAERRWIAQLKSLGCDLVNLTDGGDGLKGYRQTQETVEKRASKLRGRQRTDEERQSLSDGWTKELRRSIGQKRQGKAYGGSSPYVGVSFHKNTGRWRATLYHQNRQSSGGYHPTAEDAAEAYNQLARRLFGADARINTILTSQ